MTSTRRAPRAVIVVVIALVTLAAGCGNDEGGDGAKDGKGTVKGALRVPQDHDTIQEAVDEAEAGDLVLVDEGTYREAVDVTTPDITIRGIDRNKVVLDGGFELENGIRVLETDGV